MSERERYLAAIESSEWANKLKKTVADIAAQKQLSPVMNNTKRLLTSCHFYPHLF